MRGCRKRAGYTLIELLIVVAIIAIMTAGSLTVIVAPMQEQAFASIDHARQTGESACFARLVEDAHAAVRVAIAEPGKLVLETTGTRAESVMYYVDAEKHLRRLVAPAGQAPDATGSAGAALMDDVQTFTAVSDGPTRQCRIVIAASTAKYNRTLSASHELVLGVGADSWTGEAVQ